MNIDTAKQSLVELRIPRRPEFLRVVRLLVSGYVSRWPVPVDEVENIKVAVSEACNSAMRGGDAAIDEERLDIKFWSDGARLCFEIRDEGAHTAEPDADMDDSGLGMLLIRTLMEDVDVCSEPGRGDVIIMKKTINQA